MRRLLALAVLVGCSSAKATKPKDAAPVAATPSAVDAFVTAEMERQHVPGVAIAVIRGGKVEVARGYGFANLEHMVPVTTETIFQSGSMGKQFTATAVMLLVEDGKLGLDDPISKYWSDTPRAFRAITVRNLLTHTSGIPDYATEDFDYRRDYTEDELRKLAFGLDLDFAPGSKWSYSNTGYALLGFLIHRVSGQFYGDLLHDRVFAPLGMKTTRIISEADIIPHRAAGYHLVGGELKNQDWVSPTLNTTADGALYYSIEDLIAWDRGLRAGAILGADSWRQVYAPVRLTGGQTYPYGFGWSVEPVKGHAVHRHDGAWQGFTTDIVRYPDDDLTVIALCNSGDADPEAFTDGIIAVVAPELAPP